jgi:hypothetical protein
MIPSLRIVFLPLIFFDDVFFDLPIGVVRMSIERRAKTQVRDGDVRPILTAVIARSDSDEAIHFRGTMDCFAALAMTGVQRLGSVSSACDYWMPAFAGMTAILWQLLRYPFPLPRMKSKSQPSSACKMVSLKRCA